MTFHARAPLLVACLAPALAFGCSARAPATGPGDAAPPDIGVYDPDAGTDDADAGPFTWTLGAASPMARFEANGAVMGGDLWVMGGFTASTLDVTRRVDIYNPATDSWRAGPDLPGAETHVGVAVMGDDILVVGGFTGTFSTATRPPTTDAVWRWTAATAQWVAGPALPGPRAAFATALVGSALHIAGGLGADGNTDTHDHLVWDLAGATAAWTSAGPLPDARNHGGGAAAGGRMYAIAGRHQWNEVSGDVADVDELDPATGAWTARAPIPTARSEIGAATFAMSDGRILVVGGSVAGIKPNSDVLIYDPAQDAWSPLPPLPEPRKGAVAARLGRRLIVTTGSPTSIDPSATTFVGCCL